MKVLTLTEKTKGISKALVAIMIVIVLAASVGFYLLLTFPRNSVDFPVSFTIGADVERVEFSVPVLHGWVQVEVVVSSGNLVWTAKILRGNNMMWVDSKSQAGKPPIEANGQAWLVGIITSPLQLLDLALWRL